MRLENQRSARRELYQHQDREWLPDDEETIRKIDEEKKKNLELMKRREQEEEMQRALDMQAQKSMKFTSSVDTYMDTY